LDRVRLDAFLREAVPGLDGELEIKQFPGGHSNLTYYLRMGGREMVLRRPPFGSTVKSAHDMSREYRVLAALHSVYPYAPRPLAFSDDASVIGDQFYVMERIVGTVIRRELPPGLTLTPDQCRGLYENLVRVQYELHSLDYQAVGLGDLGKPEGYVRRQVEGWSRRYRNARTPDARDGDAVMDWFAGHVPPDNDRPGIIHNDFKLDNVTVSPDDPSRVIGVFDWEMATLGDPLMDFCNSLSYVYQEGDPPEMAVINTYPRVMHGTMTREEMIALYEALSGRKIGDIHYYYAFGLFRLAVIAQQIYYRYYHGKTRDERFAFMVVATNTLVDAAARSIERAG